MVQCIDFKYFQFFFIIYLFKFNLYINICIFDINVERCILVVIYKNYFLCCLNGMLYICMDINFKNFDYNVILKFYEELRVLLISKFLGNYNFMF